MRTDVQSKCVVCMGTEPGANPNPARCWSVRLTGRKWLDVRTLPRPARRVGYRMQARGNVAACSVLYVCFVRGKRGEREKSGERPESDSALLDESDADMMKLIGFSRRVHGPDDDAAGRRNVGDRKNFF